MENCFESNRHHNPFIQKENHNSQIQTFLEPTTMDRYVFLNEISRGVYGVVYRAWDNITGKLVAIKQEFQGLSESTEREIAILDSLPRHPSIVEFNEAFMDEYKRVFVVMEYLENDIGGFIDFTKHHLTLSQVKFLMKQLLEGIDHLHEYGIMHRDLKPSNILMNNKGQLKICDFGLSRQAEERSGSYTPGMVTLWYRAPKILLGDEYGGSVDMWSAGCIMAELVLREVIFKGNSEIEQLRIIYNSLVNGVRDKFKVAAAGGGSPLLTECGFDLLEKLLAFNGEDRITAKDALDHAWFNEYYGRSPLY